MVKDCMMVMMILMHPRPEGTRDDDADDAGDGDEGYGCCLPRDGDALHQFSRLLNKRNVSAQHESTCSCVQISGRRIVGTPRFEVQGSSQVFAITSSHLAHVHDTDMWLRQTDMRLRHAALTASSPDMRTGLVASRAALRQPGHMADDAWATPALAIADHPLTLMDNDRPLALQDIL